MSGARLRYSGWRTVAPVWDPHAVHSGKLALRYHGVVQLELFSPDRTALDEGWEAVAQLDFERARERFENVLARWPETGEAVEALRWLTVVGRALAGMEHDTPEALVSRLWAAREPLAHTGLGGRFREAVLTRLLWEMESHGTGGPLDGPCRGEVLLEAGHVEAAVRWFRKAVETPGARSDLRRLLGLALWSAGRHKEARRQWLIWLLTLAPGNAPSAAASLPDPEIGRLVATHGIGGAPAWAWLEGLAPMIQEDELPVAAAEILAEYRHILAAEAAARRGDLDTAITHREALLRLDPELFRRYMSRWR